MICTKDGVRLENWKRSEVLAARGFLDGRTKLGNPALLLRCQAGTRRSCMCLVR